jgi:uncharacterized protein YigA (DUF484 family)
MSDTMTKTKDTNLISEKTVLEWLKDNPDFFKHNPEILDHLTPPSMVSGKGLADFQAFMIKRLKDDKNEVISSAREIVETTRANMNNQARIHKAVLLMLEAKNFEDFVYTITIDLASLLDVDIVSLVLEAEGDVIPHINTPGVRVVSPGTIDLLMKDQKIHIESETIGLDDIYGGGSGLVKSQIIVKLQIDHEVPPALLAFGSRDVGTFQEGQATDQINFLCSVIERCFAKWLFS